MLRGRGSMRDKCPLVAPSLSHENASASPRRSSTLKRLARGVTSGVSVWDARRSAACNGPRRSGNARRERVGRAHARLGRARRQPDRAAAAALARQGVAGGEIEKWWRGTFESLPRSKRWRGTFKCLARNGGAARSNGLAHEPTRRPSVGRARGRARPTHTARERRGVREMARHASGARRLPPSSNTPTRVTDAPPLRSLARPTRPTTRVTEDAWPLAALARPTRPTNRRTDDDVPNEPTTTAARCCCPRGRDALPAAARRDGRAVRPDALLRRLQLGRPRRRGRGGVRRARQRPRRRRPPRAARPRRGRGTS